MSDVHEEPKGAGPVDASDATAANDLQRAGLATMAELYGDDRGFAELFDEQRPESAAYIADTAEHLFARIWNRPGLSKRDRRLLAIGVIAAHGRADVAETQFAGALLHGELTREQLGEVVLHLAYYAGWPQGQAMHSAARAAAARVAESNTEAP